VLKTQTSVHLQLLIALYFPLHLLCTSSVL